MDRAYYLEHRERVLAQQREYRAANPEKVRAVRAANYQANRERTLARQKARREADLPADALRHRAKRQRNIEKYRRQEVNRTNMRRVRLQGDLTAEEWQGILEEFDHRCAYCQAQGRLTQEHITPISRGGQHTKANVVPACGSCNSSKGVKTLFEFAAVVPIKMRQSARV